MCGLLPGRFLFRIMQTAGDQWFIGIAFFKTDLDFLPNPGQPDDTITITGPIVHDPDPAGSFFILLTLSVPMVLHFDTPEFVGIYLFSLRAGYRSGLNTAQLWFLLFKIWPPWRIPWYSTELADQAGLPTTELLQYLGLLTIDREPGQ